MLSVSYYYYVVVSCASLLTLVGLQIVMMRTFASSLFWLVIIDGKQKQQKIDVNVVHLPIEYITKDEFQSINKQQHLAAIYTALILI